MAGSSVKNNRGGWRYDFTLPNTVCGSERRVTTEINLLRGGEPAQSELISPSLNKGCLGKIHFPCDKPHPFNSDRLIKQADCGRISRERSLRKGIDEVNPNIHPDSYPL